LVNKQGTNKCNSLDGISALSKVYLEGEGACFH